MSKCQYNEWFSFIKRAFFERQRNPKRFIFEEKEHRMKQDEEDKKKHQKNI